MFTYSILEGSEDCLYLNVYSSCINPSIPLPVMVWIHGGGFMSGSGDSSLYGPDFLIEKNIILVTFNYRLEVLGFLCLETEDVPGNAGMKDQVAALRWVKNNIAQFGGDPNNITIAGESAGSASVAHHLVSPMSKGLFKRAILQSGTCNSYWGIAYKPRQRAIALARQLGFDGKEKEDLLDFFKKIPAKDLIRKKVAITIAEEMHSNVILYFTVCDEKFFPNNERFFYGNIHEHLRNGIHQGVEVMIGYTADEGYIQFGLIPLDPMLSSFKNCIESFCPVNLIYKLPINEQLEIGKKMKKYYYGDSDITEENIKPIAKYVGCMLFVFDIIQWAKFCANKRANNIYLYKFSCISERNVMSQLFGGTIAAILKNNQIVCHADDLMYIFKVNLIDIPVDKNSKSYRMINNTVTLWTNFVKYGYVFLF